ncbi:MAG: hypothetical protein HZA53_14010 [Planctomycetes bacterium]|nr:hypothetical protein [Planctomycetota bacterium]
MIQRRALLGAVASLALGSSCKLDSSGMDASAHFQMAVASNWSYDPAWNDGLAEKCVYEATRTIYGKERRYLATAYTNKERVDPRTTCKTDDPKGLEVFKHHWSEIVPTENYAYRFSTMSYYDVLGGRPNKLTVSTQEDCGASFKECWRSGNQFLWSDSVYFPGGGRREGRLDGVFTFADSLSIALRRLPADLGREELELFVVPPQKDTHQASWTLQRWRVRGRGRSTQELPIGSVDADGYDVFDAHGALVETYWFAADEKAPILRAMVRYEGPNGVTYRLKSIERTAYWKH